MRVTDVMLSIPTLLLVIVFVSIVGPSLQSVIAVIGLLGWPITTRLIRGQLLSLREAEFITAARTIGVADRTIAMRHLLPNLVGPLTVVATFGVAEAILLEASLRFLGLGVRPPTSSLGEMINQARAPSTLQGLPWIWLPAGVVIATDRPRRELRRRRAARRPRPALSPARLMRVNRCGVKQRLSVPARIAIPLRTLHCAHDGPRNALAAPGQRGAGRSPSVSEGGTSRRSDPR